MDASSSGRCGTDGVKGHRGVPLGAVCFCPEALGIELQVSNGTSANSECDTEMLFCSPVHSLSHSLTHSAVAQNHTHELCQKKTAMRARFS